MQSSNLYKNDFYEIDGKYQRLLKICIDVRKMLLHVGNELLDKENEKRVKEWDFSLNLYTQKELSELWKNVWLELIKVRWRYSDSNVFWYEPQAIYIFKKV